MFLLHFSQFKTFLFFGHSKTKVYIRSCVLCVYAGTPLTDGNCTQCPDKCIWSKHKHVPYRYEYTLITEIITLDQLKRTYEQARGEVGKQTTLLDRIRTAFDRLRETNLDLVKMSKNVLTSFRKLH